MIIYAYSFMLPCIFSVLSHHIAWDSSRSKKNIGAFIPLEWCSWFASKLHDDIYIFSYETIFHSSHMECTEEDCYLFYITCLWFQVTEFPKQTTIDRSSTSHIRPKLMTKCTRFPVHRCNIKWNHFNKPCSFLEQFFNAISIFCA
jgi:hypothetical protein